MNVKLSRSLRFLVCCLFIFTTYSPPANSAPQGAVRSSAPTALNLNSKRSSVMVTSANLNSAASTSITVGGSAMTVHAGQLITPAEYAALSQVLAGGKQSLIVNNFGQAVAGSLQLNSLVSLGSSGNLSSLVVPRNVTLVDNFASGSPLNMVGNLVNFGDLFAYSSNTAVKTAVFSANNIFNESGALISTVLPASMGLSSSPLHLTLNALNSLTNNGTISSSGNLALSAGGALTNTGSVQAAQNLNVTSNAGQITNSGLLSALAGNININTLATQNLIVNNAAGTMQALNGTINFRDGSYSGSADISVSAGNVLAQTVNLNDGTGHANLDVDNFAGTLNATACNLVTYAPSNDLVLGDINVTGDPVLVNPTGSVQITSNIGPGAILIAAEDNITAAPGVTSISSGGLGDITIVSGAAISQTANVISISALPYPGNGQINFGSQAITISTDSATGSANNINLIAYGAGAGNHDIGIINAPNSTLSAASTFTGGTNGKITVISGVNNGGQVFVPKIGAASSILIASALPTTSDGQPITFDATTGAQISTNSFVPGNNSISASLILNSITSGGGSVTVFGTGTISANGTIDTRPTSGTGSGGSALLASRGSISTGTIRTAGGNINLVSQQSISYSDIDSSVTSGNAGNILLAAGTNNISFGSSQLTFAAPGATSGVGSSLINGAANSVITAQAATGQAGDVNLVLVGSANLQKIIGNNITITASGAVNINATVTALDQVLIANGGYTTSGGNVVISIPSGVITSGPLTPSGGTGAIGVSLGATITAANATIQANAGGNLAVNANQNVSGTMLLQAPLSSNIQLKVPLNVPGNLTLEALQGNFDLPLSQPLTVAGTLTIQADSGSITVNQMTTTPKAGTLALVANTTITVNAPLTVTGSLSFVANTGNITLNQDVTAPGSASFSTPGQVLQPFAAGAAVSVPNINTSAIAATFLSFDNSKVLVVGGFVESVVDATTGKVLSSFTVGQSINAQFGGFSSTNSTELFVAGNNPNTNQGFLSIVVNNSVVKEIPLLGSVTAMVVNPKTNFVYALSNANGGTFFVINATTNTIVSQTNVAGASVLSADPTGQYVYVAGGNTVQRYQVLTNSFVGSGTIAGATSFTSATIDGSGAVLYAADNSSNKIFAINPVSLQLINTFQLPTAPANKILSVMINPQGTELYVTEPTSVQLLQANTGTLDQQLAIPNTSDTSMSVATVGVVGGRFKVFVPSFVGPENKMQLNSFTDAILKAGGVSVSTPNANVSLVVNTTGVFDSLFNAPNVAVADLGTIRLGTSTVTGSLLLGASGSIINDGPLTASSLQLQTVGPSSDIDMGASSTISGSVLLTSLDMVSFEGALSGSSVTIGAATVEMTSGSLTATNGSVTFNGTPGSGTALEGSGSVTATNGIVFNSSGNLISLPTMSFDGTFNLQGGTPGTTINAVNGFVSFTAQSMVTSNQTTINACLVENPNALVGPVTINVSPNCTLGPGCGTLTNPTGNITLSPNILVQTNGKALTVIAAGNIFAQGLPTIDLSSATTSGGALNLIAGFIFAPADTNLTLNTTTTFSLMGPSMSGGSVILPNTAINTSTTSAPPQPGIFTGAGGAVTIVAHASSTNPGTITVAGINTSSKNGGAGSVTLIGQGGVQTGGITSNGAISGGSVQINGSEPVAGTNTQVFNGNLTGGGFSAKAPVNGAGAGITINGAINASSVAGSGGNVSLVADNSINVTGGISSNVLQGGPGAGAGGITLQSTNANIAIGGSLNASGSVDTSLSSTLNGVNGGNVSISTASFALISGNILTSGGSTQGTGDGANAGNLTIATSTSNPATVAVGNVTVDGFIDLSGGSTKSGATGGSGGKLTVNAGSFVVSRASATGFSINAGSGTGKTSGRRGSMQITTYSEQNLPTTLDTTSSTKNIVALPGGMFSVGDPTLTNGTKGNLTDGGPAVTPKQAGRVVGGRPFRSGNITITVIGAAINVNLGGTVVGIAPDNGSGTRTMITPATALALYGLSRNPGQPNTKQTVGLNASGQAINAATAGGNSRLTVNSYDFPSNISAFNLGTVDTNNSNLITLTVNGPQLPVDLSAVSNSIINGTLAFSSSGTVLFGRSVTLGSTGTLSAASSGTLNINGDFSALTDNGKILGKTIVINPANNRLTLSMGTVGQIGVQSGTGTVTVNASTLTVTGGAITTGTTFSQTAIGTVGTVSINTTFAGTAAVGNLSASTLTLAAPTSSGIAIAANADVGASNMTITTSQGLSIGNNATVVAGVTAGGSSNMTAGGSITFGNGSIIQARKHLTVTATAGTLGLGTNVIVSSLQGNVALTGSSITVQNGSLVQAGDLKDGAPTTGVVQASDVLADGSVTMTSTGGDITINSGTGDSSTIINSVGLNTTIFSSNNISIGDAAQFRVDGGNLLIGANGKLDGGTADSFIARSLGAVGGGIALGSVTNVNTVLARNLTATSRTAPGTAPNPTTPLGTDVVINNSGGTSGAVVLNTTTSPSINLSNTGTQAVLTLQGGAMNFTAGPQSTPNEILMNGAQFTTYGLVPMSYESQGEASHRDLVVDTGDVGDDEAQETQTVMNLSF